MFNTIIKEIKELKADKKIWIGILTVLIMIIIGTSYNRNNSEYTSTEHLRLGIINHDESIYSDMLLSYFNGSETFSSLISVTAGEEKEVKSAFDQGDLDIYLEIPKDFAMNLIRLEHSPINVTINISDTTKAILFQNVLRSYEKYIASVEANAVGLYEIMEQDGMDQELIDETNRKVSIDFIFTTLGKEEFFSFEPLDQYPTTTLILYYVISLLIMALLYSGLYIGFQILREMKQGTFTRLRTTRTPLYQFLIAKMVILITILTITTVIALSIISKPITIMQVLFSLSIVMFSICLSVLLSSLFNTTQRFVLAGNLLFFCFIVIGGGIIPMQFLPQSMVNLAKITPNYYMLKGILYMNQGQTDKIGFIMASFIGISIGMISIALILFGRRSVNYDEV